MTEHRFHDPGAATPAPAAPGATLAGLGAILLWAALALFTVAARGLPPFELLALSFGVACLSGTAVLEAVMNHGRRLYCGATCRMAGGACSRYVRTDKSFDAPDGRRTATPANTAVAVLAV